MDTSVGLVESYLRLNGYLTVTEFPVQQATAAGRYDPATDIDIIAIHLPWAAETVPAARGTEPAAQLREDERLEIAQDLPDLMIGEVKEGAGELNRKLSTPEILHAALRRSGCCPEAHIAHTAAELARRGEFYINDGSGVACRVRLVSFCGYVDPGRLPGILTVTLEHIVRFVDERLRTYWPILRSAQFKDPAIEVFKLMRKLGARIDFEKAVALQGLGR